MLCNGDRARRGGKGVFAQGIVLRLEYTSRQPGKMLRVLATTPVPLHVLFVDSILRSVSGNIRCDKALGNVHWMVKSLGLVEGNLLDGPTVVR